MKNATKTRWFDKIFTVSDLYAHPVPVVRKKLQIIFYTCPVAEWRLFGDVRANKQ